VVSRARGQGPKPGAVRPQRLPTAPAVGIAQARRGMASQSPWPSGRGLPRRRGPARWRGEGGQPGRTRRPRIWGPDHVCPGRPVPAINDMSGAFQTAPGDTLELNVVRGTGDRTTHVILGESGQPRRGSLSSLRPAGTTYLIVCYDYGQVLQDPADTQPGPDTDIHFSAEAASRFLSAAGLVVDPASGTRVAGHIDLGPDHHTPWGVVHGGVYATAVESAAGLGASLAVRDRGQFAPVCTMRLISCARPPRVAPRLSPSPCRRAVSSNYGWSPSPASAARRSHAAGSGCRTFRFPAPAQADKRPPPGGSAPGAVAFSVQAAVIARPAHSALMISAAGQGRGFPPCCSSARVTMVRSCSPSP